MSREILIERGFYEDLIFTKPYLDIIQYVKSQTKSFRACSVTSSSYRNRWNQAMCISFR